VDPVLVLPNVSVDHVANDSMGISGQFAVVLRVHPQDVAELVRAARIGAVDLITVPVDSQYDDDASASSTGLTAAQ
jgi:FixJ family two-component response regulator